MRTFAILLMATPAIAERVALVVNSCRESSANDVISSLPASTV